MTTLTTPHVTRMQVIPVAGHDGMLLNLSGAHGPFFTRNIVILTDSAGHTGLGEVPGGEKIRQTLEPITRSCLSNLFPSSQNPSQDSPQNQPADPGAKGKFF